MGQAIGDEFAEFLVKFVGGDDAFANDYEGAGDFSRGQVGLSDYSAIADGGMFEQNGFDFGGRDRESFVLDHLLAAVEHAVEAIFVAAHDIAGVIPSVA